MQRNRSPELSVPLDHELRNIDNTDLNTEALLIQERTSGWSDKPWKELLVEIREVLALRELEEMSYRDIASITDLPLGTVMSRLARGRKRLQRALTNHVHAEVLS
jgi:DNA-directed RNA polymerase specialized sigma24 family protein